MIYLWEYPEEGSVKEIGGYLHDSSPASYLLKLGRHIQPDEFTPMPTVKFDLPRKKFSGLDCLTTDTMIPLVNPRLKKILEAIAPDEVEFFPAECICKDGKLDDYYFVNVLQLFTGIDHEKSEYTKIANDDAILRFKYLTYKKGCMGTYNLARDEEYSENLLVSEKVKLAFDKEKVTGVWLARPEEYYRPLSELL